MLKEKFMNQAKLYVLAIAAIAGASLALPFTAVAQSDQTKGASGTSAAPTQQTQQTPQQQTPQQQTKQNSQMQNEKGASAQTHKGNKTASLSAKHSKKSMRMSRAARHERKLYGSMRTPTRSQMEGVGAGMSGATGPNGPSVNNPSGLK
jgi:hypothetical protein